MSDILQEIVAHKRVELQQMKLMLPERDIHRRVEALVAMPQPSLRRALLDSGTGIIAEFKRRSPSKGWIKASGRADVIPLGYQQHGAAAVSILTDNRYFGGSDSYIVEARRSGLTLPVLYKNFVVDEYQLFQARLAGASAVLLIAACLTLRECSALTDMAHQLGLEVLLEMHDEHETGYADVGPDLCGINNRHLGTFVTDVQTSFRLAARLPHDALWVSESGISNAETVLELRQAGYRGFLIGETFMRQADPAAALADFVATLTK
ncbi:MAG: indole-3-glycerol phosphate synthase TrpC [Prevotella sp.]|nr:indole-3-glycerol phosphate synthase TrpC [Prevotella sp.]